MKEKPQGRTGHLSTTSLTRAFMHRRALVSGLRTGLVCSWGTWGAYAWSDDKGQERGDGIGPVCLRLRPWTKPSRTQGSTALWSKNTEYHSSSHLIQHPMGAIHSHKWHRRTGGNPREERKIMTWTGGGESGEGSAESSGLQARPSGQSPGSATF